MSKRTLLLIVAAVVAAFTALSIKNHLSQAPVEAPVVQAARILIAKRDLSPGSFIQASQDLDWGVPPAAPVVAVPTSDENAPDNTTPDATKTDKEAAPKENYLYEGTVKMMDFNGAVVRRQLHAGDPVPASALMKAGAGGLLSAVLNPGMRAVAISIDAVSGTAGFVLPGDYIDLIVTREITRSINNGREQEQRKIVFSKIFVQNVRVLAVDQMLDNPENKAMLAKTVTVEVTPTQAQEIAVAADLGKISISLRSAVRAESPDGKTDEALSKSVSDTDVSGEQQKTPDVSEQVKMFRPKETQNLEFYKTHAN